MKTGFLLNLKSTHYYEFALSYYNVLHRYVLLYINKAVLLSNTFEATTKGYNE